MSVVRRGMRIIRTADGREWWRVRGGRHLAVIAGGGGGGKTTVVSETKIPPKSEEELGLLRKQNELLDIQLGELKRQNSVLEETFPQQKELFAAQTAAATTFAQAQKAFLDAQLPFVGKTAELQQEQLQLQTELSRRALAELDSLKPSAEQQEIQRLSDQRTLAILRGEAPPLSPAQEARIRTVFDQAESEGEDDIRQFGEEIAAARGLRLTDTPIGSEVINARTDLAAKLKASRAAAELNLGQTEQAFAESVRQFQANLNQTAYQNRLALLGRSSAASTGGATFAPAVGGQSPVFSTNDPIAAFGAITPLINSMTGERIAGATRIEKSSFQTNPGAFDYAKLLIGAAGGAAGAIALSSARFKKDIEPLDRDEYDRARRRLVRETPVTRWRYRHEPDGGRPHTGPILELSPEEIKASETHLDLLSYVGNLHAATKAIDRDVQEIQATLRRARAAA